MKVPWAFFFLALLISEVSAKVDTAELAKHQSWLRLLHFQPRFSLFNPGRSLADAGQFFLASDGKNSAQAELEANIDALVKFSQNPNTLLEKFQQPYPCVFPARMLWLKKQLNLNLPIYECPDYDRWRKRLPISSVQMVFASYYAGNPASFFGHTFLKLKADAKNDTDLLDQIVNFSAATDTDHGVEFAVRGLLGGFHGLYFMTPYYMKIKEYHHHESRDLWEYAIPMSPDEIDILLAHLWEMLHTTWFDYYFLDENCSFQLLQLLEVAKPQLTLTNGFFLFAMPIDTIKKLLEGLSQNGANLTQTEPVFRPSFRKVVQHHYNQLSQQQKMMVRHYINTDQIKTSDADDVMALESAVLLLRYRRFEQKLSKLQEDRLKELLLRRSQLGNVQNHVASEPPIPTAPHKSHGTSMLSWQSGLGSNREDFHELTLRAAFHDLGNWDAGMPPFSESEIFKTTAGIEGKSGKIVLKKFTPLAITTLAPMSDIINEYSWKINVGIERDYQLSNQNLPGLLGRMDLGFGLSTQWQSTDIFYFLPVVQLNVGRDLEHGWAWAPGIEFGQQLRFDHVSTGIKAIVLWDINQEGRKKRRERLEGQLSYFMAQNHEWRFGVEYHSKVMPLAKIEKLCSIRYSFFF